MSSSVKTRSAAAIACCITVYLVDRSRMGVKNLPRYSMNATTVPTVSVPATVRLPPCHRRLAIAIAPIASTIEYSAASAAMARELARRYATLMTSKSRPTFGSCANACTTFMPDMCSCRNAFMRASRTRMSRNASRTQRRK